MRQCAEHVTFQLPNERTRVSYLLDAVQCNDPGLQAAMAQVRTDSGPVGKMNDFEATASYLLQYDPVSKKRAAGSKRGMESISAVSGSDDADISGLHETGPKPKPSKGKTGVEFRYHTPAEYNQLQPDQKTELHDFRENKKGNAGPGKAKKLRQSNTLNGRGNTNKQKKWIASAVEKQLAQLQATDAVEDDKEADFKSYIMSLISEAKKPTPPAANASTATVKKVTLQSILRKVKR
jgi:hypothetical protein